MTVEELLERLKQLVIEGKAPETKSLTQEALDMGIPALEIVNRGMIPGMEVISERFSRQEIFVPEMMVAARAMKTGLTLLETFLSRSDVPATGVAVVGTVAGDLHDIGKNLVCMMLEGAGFKVHNLGVNVSPQKFLQAARDHNADIVGMSSLLTTGFFNVETTVKTFRESDLKERVKLMVGGAAITEKYAAKIGADGYGKDASEAVLRAKEMVALKV